VGGRLQRRATALGPWIRNPGGVRRRTAKAMACSATPYGLRCAAHCFNRAHAQNNRPALIPAGGKLGVRSFCLKPQKWKNFIVNGKTFLSSYKGAGFGMTARSSEQLGMADVAMSSVGPRSTSVPRGKI